MANIEPYAAKGVWDPPAYAQAVKVTGAQTILYIAGQVAYDDEGNTAHSGEQDRQGEPAHAGFLLQFPRGRPHGRALDASDRRIP